jgi:hypothetical protein
MVVLKIFKEPDKITIKIFKHSKVTTKKLSDGPKIILHLLLPLRKVISPLQ